jgi:hypothetical protein
MVPPLWCGDAAAVKAHKKWTFTEMKVYSSMKIHAFLSCVLYIGAKVVLPYK